MVKGRKVTSDKSALLIIVGIVTALAMMQTQRLSAWHA